MNMTAELAASNHINTLGSTALTGHIKVDVCYNRDHIRSVEITNTRPFTVTRLFAAKPVDQVLTMMPSLFYICGMGQLIAALRAVESASGIPESLATKQARDALLFAESLREQVFNWVTNWAGHHKSKLSHVVDWFNQCRAQLGWSLALAASVEDNAGSQASIEVLAEQLRMVIKPFLPAAGRFPSLFAMGVEESVREIIMTCDKYPLGLAAQSLNLKSQDHLMPVLAALSSDRAEQFCHQPLLNGAPAETGCWARQNIEAKGFVVEGRLRALFREITTAPERLMSLAKVNNAISLETASSHGCALVETARGTLLHRVQLDESDHVKQYQIIAPTEWNFHPQGSLKTLLEGLYLPEERVNTMVETMIKLLDPCVAWELELTHA